MDQTKLDRIAALIEQKRSVDSELAALIGGGEMKEKRKWTRKKGGDDGDTRPVETNSVG